MASIFISYRREDAAAHAGRLCDRLNGLFGDGRVFMDVEDIRPGEDFARAIQQKISASKLVLAVIGPRWVESMAERQGGREDFVRRELATALRLKLTVVPVLVGGARMPEAGDMPAELASLHRRNAVEIRDAQFDQDVEELSRFLRAEIGQPRRRWWVALSVAILLAGGAGAYWSLRPGHADISGNWVAEMFKEGQRPFRIELTFEVSGGAVSGTVRYPTGTGAILDGSRNGNRLTFRTSHISDVSNQPVTIRYQGEIVGAEIHLTSADDIGIAKGVARRGSP